ncbi:hypothetical protein ENBRE01_0273 [Enteropsectra breve]|nr:hypothetical protein ENBRE01_0273 [Enteropsectra breve]
MLQNFTLENLDCLVTTILGIGVFKSLAFSPVRRLLLSGCVLAVFVVFIALSIAQHLLIYFLIKKKNDNTKVKVPFKNGFFGRLDESRPVEMTTAEYDATQCKYDLMITLPFVFVICPIAYYFFGSFALIFVAVNFVRNILFNPLSLIYLYGVNLKRPFHRVILHELIWGEAAKTLEEEPTRKKED